MPTTLEAFHDEGIQDSKYGHGHGRHHMTLPVWDGNEGWPRDFDNYLDWTWPPPTFRSGSCLTTTSPPPHQPHTIDCPPPGLTRRRVVSRRVPVNNYRFFSSGYRFPSPPTFPGQTGSSSQRSPSTWTLHGHRHRAHIIKGSFFQPPGEEAVLRKHASSITDCSLCTARGIRSMDLNSTF